MKTQETNFNPKSLKRQAMVKKVARQIGEDTRKILNEATSPEHIYRLEKPVPGGIEGTEFGASPEHQEKPKKLIRKNITAKLKEGEWEQVTDKDELNKLYALKVMEELEEIQASKHTDIMEFVDLIQVAFSFARRNGFTHEQLSVALIAKTVDKGNFDCLALNNLNPDNPSNRLYFHNPNAELSSLRAENDRLKSELLDRDINLLPQKDAEIEALREERDEFALDFLAWVMENKSSIVISKALINQFKAYTLITEKN